MRPMKLHGALMIEIGGRGIGTRVLNRQPPRWNIGVTQFSCQRLWMAVSICGAPSGRTEEFFNAFFPTIEGEVKQRIKKWSKKRNDRLFGNKIPNAVFLTRESSID